MRRTLFCLAVLMIASMVLISCGSSSSNSTGSRPSGVGSRAFVSNPLNPSAAAGAYLPVLNIVDTSTDRLSRFTVGLNSGPGLIQLSPNGLLTLVFSPNNNSVTVIDNQKESILQNSSTNTSVPAIILPGPTESMTVGQDELTAFAAVPTAAVNATPLTPGAVEVLGITTGTILATLPVPGARTIVSSPNGNRLLTFGDNSSTVTVITPSNVSTSVDPRTPICCFDHPVWGVFSSDNSTAYVFDCGPECGGTAAGISVLDMNTNSILSTTPLPAATYGLLNGSTLFVAGTPPGTPCDPGTAAANCGVLNLLNTSSMTVSNGSPILITDGYHNRMALSPNGQLFVGAKTCTNVTGSSETRGCLAIYNTTTPGVVFPPDNGDVTGMTVIPGRNVMYVCENGNFRIYDTNTDQLLVPPNGQAMIDIIGNSTDVVFVN